MAGRHGCRAACPRLTTPHSPSCRRTQSSRNPAWSCQSTRLHAEGQAGRVCGGRLRHRWCPCCSTLTVDKVPDLHKRVPRLPRQVEVVGLLRGGSSGSGTGSGWVKATQPYHLLLPAGQTPPSASSDPPFSAPHRDFQVQSIGGPGAHVHAAEGVAGATAGVLQAGRRRGAAGSVECRRLCE